jgi:di/tripeptidase
MQFLVIESKNTINCGQKNLISYQAFNAIRFKIKYIKVLLIILRFLIQNFKNKASHLRQRSILLETISMAITA